MHRVGTDMCEGLGSSESGVKEEMRETDQLGPVSTLFLSKFPSQMRDPLSSL